MNPRTSAPQKHPRKEREKETENSEKEPLSSPSPNYLSRGRMVEKENYQREKEVTQEENRRKEYGDKKITMKIEY